jgi:hypothetical protein
LCGTVVPVGVGDLGSWPTIWASCVTAASSLEEAIRSFAGVPAEVILTAAAAVTTSRAEGRVRRRSGGMDVVGAGPTAAGGQGAGLGRTGRVVDEPVVPVRLAVNSAGCRVARWLGKFSVAVAACPRTTEVAALQENCFDAEPILQDPTIEALELT